MKPQSLLAIFCMLAIVGVVNSQKSLQESGAEATAPPTII